MKQLFGLAIFTMMSVVINAQETLENGRLLEDGSVYNYSDDDKAVKYYEKALDFFQSGKYKKAVKFYKKSIQEDVNFIEAYDNLALSYRHMGQLDSAEKYYLISTELFPKGAMAIQNLGVVYEYRKDYKTALDYYEKLIEVEENNPEGYYGAARMCLQLEDLEGAEEYGLMCEKKYKLKGGGYIQDAQYVLGIAYYRMDDMENAKKYFQLAKDNGIKISRSLIVELDLH